ncbi:beta-ketoacyl-ACP synthase III [Pelodictyon luteolum]|uniref:Beta-ketoacyl-[acyl-carrier-protein] synthase III n=1 Tax=Chlorobium luteolum (strain DSM 273 / BCRC 81028 / 2530) TaxID=319225 RepID=FABH_CHLL3|nr:beta-ketoacyl-ACP synthase III [Pelodictyon luteolum]Q3B6K8.1 RecName: Full=Beta-ketoacyl-[acyl-carrier-protein] synthase III; Short=Beta-ketoacyl-ACP synthase III; Short=KAS III; AltName: Full=3-oxoacyl-[acyl-carrier-protein] synthase 3; AltName: Full=3-oxoacyl-[acyl-carrier-protein] synthase III [Pelodictyon luteolum DSM 273]ABB23023.1 3-oxoacyl-[acyl-carrier-protein] synthase III [Pelodictyon luteolum DSM 273]
MNAAISATARYLPEGVLSNLDLERMLDTNDEWIRSRTGISERRILRDPKKATSYMCGEVASQLLRKRGLAAEELELIIVATMTPDMMFPSTACLVQDIIGAKNAWAFDINAACSGFLYALNTASQFIKAGTHKNVMVIGGDKMSSIIDYTDRSTAILFGDGAGGVILEAAESEGFGVLDARMYSDGTNGKDHLLMKGGGSLHPATHDTVDQHLHYIYQDGRMVFKSAVTSMADVAAEIMERNGLTSDDVSWLVPHQANQRIISATAERMGIDESKVISNVGRYGNTTAGTIPICLSELDDGGHLEHGSNLVLVSFGAGYTWGGVYVKWQ